LQWFAVLPGFGLLFADEIRRDERFSQAFALAEFLIYVGALFFIVFYEFNEYWQIYRDEDSQRLPREAPPAAPKNSPRGKRRRRR